MKFKTLRVSRVPVERASFIFDKFGFQISKKQIRSDIKNGAPLNEDGTMNIIHYASWLFKKRHIEMSALQEARNSPPLHALRSKTPMNEPKPAAPPCYGENTQEAMLKKA